MTKDDLVSDVAAAFRHRRFAAGLFLAFVDFLRELDAVPRKFPGLPQFFRAFPQATVTSQNQRANTLIVTRGENRTLSIRPFYNARETFFIAEQGRLSYPSCAPHATQAWGDYRHWIDTLLTLSASDINKAEASVVDLVLKTLPDQRVDPASLRPLKQPFLDLLNRFDFGASGGRSGAAFQGMAFAYLRADSPQIQVSVRRVRTGSKRVGGVGDIDGYSGRRLIVSIEAKHRELDVDDLSGFARFRDEIARHRASGIVIAAAFSEKAREVFEEAGLRCLSLDDVIAQVDLWDPVKQQAAIEAFEYYAHHVERQPDLIKRFDDFTAGASDA